MGGFHEGRKVESFHLASSGTWFGSGPAGEDAEMTIRWETVNIDNQLNGVETLEPWVTWRDAGGKTIMVNLRHVEKITLGPLEVS